MSEQKGATRYTWDDLTPECRKRVTDTEEGLALFDQAIGLLCARQSSYTMDEYQALSAGRIAALAIVHRHAAAALDSLRIRTRDGGSE